MSEQKKADSYEGIFTILSIAILLATLLVAVGGVYYTFINPTF